ncbi:MAG TPA: ABC transporter ATP-binding protein [Candidatus Acidoferrales bacterium]|nr:ABC transporter ATP-binding protein [Candidatus Acidoferrales bacterium]
MRTSNEAQSRAASAKDPPLLSVRNLSTEFELRRWVFGRAGLVRAVDGVSFELRRGEAVAVVGESGCGKSSLAKTILGLYRPASGEVVFEGKNVASFGRREMRWYRAQVGYVQQDPYGALPPFMTVRRILEEPLIVNRAGNKRERERRIHEVLEEVRLTPVADILPKFPHMLSGGQQQRVVIARAMILRPKLLVADEPVSMLDASVRVQILELMRGLQQAHRLGLVYITHDLSSVRHFCERIFVMYAGKLIEKAKVDELIDGPLHPYTRALLAAIPDPDPANASILKPVPPGEPPSLLAPPPACRFHPRCPEFMKDLCDVKAPADFAPEPDHSVLCWLYDEGLRRAP